MNAQAYAHPEYDALRVVRRSETIGITEDGWKVRHRITVFDFGRVHIDAVDPDAQMQAEALVYGDKRITAMVAAKKRTKAERDAALLEGIKANFTEHGPLSVKKLAKNLKVGASNRILRLLRLHTDTFTFFGGQFFTWGLIGQTYDPPPHTRVSAVMVAIRDVIKAHGPQTSMELAERMNAHASSILHRLADHPDWFCVVEVRPRRGCIPEARVWGLVDNSESEGAE